MNLDSQKPLPYLNFIMVVSNIGLNCLYKLNFGKISCWYNKLVILILASFKTDLISCPNFFLVCSLSSVGKYALTKF